MHRSEASASMGGRRRFTGRVLLALLLIASTARAAEPTAAGTKSAIEVEGLGWFRNRELRQTLERLVDVAQKSPLDANDVDDTAFLAVSLLAERGYLHPRFHLGVRAPDGSTEEYDFDSELETNWPRSLQANRLRLRIERGVQFHIVAVQFQGLSALDAATARTYFRGKRALFSRAAQAYSPERAARGRENLETELRRRGYAEATVETPDARIDAETGAVTLTVTVDEGSLWTVRSVRLEGTPVAEVPAPDFSRFAELPWSPSVQQDLVNAVRRIYFENGYPDVTLQLDPTPARTADRVAVDVGISVNPGSQVRIGSIRFQGAEKTREPVLRRRVHAAAGDLLDPQELEEARYRLGRLGVFSAVDLSYEPKTGAVRSPVFTVKEGRTLEGNLLFGYGSYEELRGGVEVRQYNLFGAAHRSRLLLLQSMKSSRFDYSYTVPELFGEAIDGTARLFGLERQEFSFLRQEYGGSLQLSWPAVLSGIDATAGYTFQALRNLRSALSTSPSDEKYVVAASLNGALVRDRRDSPLRPESGYRLSAQVEAADHRLGGEVDYQRFELGAVYHARLGEGLLAHIGLNHGFITTLGTNDSSLPVNKRFFPGGEGSIRGYREGEAAPRGVDGRFVGAKSYSLLNLELEQSLTPNLSVVAFFDGLGTAVRLADYPWNETLGSAGLGLRYYTLIGPVRAEYGRNINRRDGDPTGTWLLSVGFPF